MLPVSMPRRELQPVETTHTEGEEKCEEEGVAERNCYGLTAKLKAIIFKEKIVRENVTQIILRNLI